jgi:glycosyltransferase involved in cell wall biosynthesis
MKVLFQGRFNLFSAPGGDTTQIVNTIKYLKKIGCDAELIIDPKTSINYDEFDLVHLFNTTRIHETWFYAKRAKRHNKRIALSTIYWNSGEFEKKSGMGFRSFLTRLLGQSKIEYLKVLVKYLNGYDRGAPALALIFKGFRRMQYETVEMADIFLPNAEIEMSSFIQDLSNRDNLNYRVIPNAVDTIDGTESDQINTEIKRENDLVLCVGRIDSRKNQLNLIRALKGSSCRLIIVGKPAPNQKKYYENVLKEGDGWVEFIEWTDFEGLKILYKRSKVHVCPSWFETPGLASLEAAYFGANVVVTPYGSTEEYFGKNAFYCDPDNKQSILNAVNEARKEKFNADLRNSIIKNYSWKIAACKTLEAYKSM